MCFSRRIKCNKHDCRAVRSPHSQKCYKYSIYLFTTVKGRLALTSPRTKPAWILTLAHRAKGSARVVIWTCASLHCRLYMRRVCESKISGLRNRHVHFNDFCICICLYVYMYMYMCVYIYICIQYVYVSVSGSVEYTLCKSWGWYHDCQVATGVQI